MTTAPLAGLGPLRPGDRVALLAPAGPPPDGQLHRAVELVSSWGLVPVVYQSATAKHPIAGYLAGPDTLRSNDFLQAWCDPSIAGILCIRGGYGCVRILDLLDAARMRTVSPKPVYGSSDVTALHEWMRETLGVPGWFTPMVSNDAVLDDPVATAKLVTAIFDDPTSRRWSSPTAEILVPGTASGTMIGGNLSLLAQTIGARKRSTVDNSGCLVLLEDVSEDTYRIDGFLQTLLRSGWFDGVAGVALGSWLDCKTPEDIRGLCLEVLGPLGVPVVWELGFGHGPGAHSIPLGVTGTLQATSGTVPELVLGGPFD